MNVRLSESAKDVLRRSTITENSVTLPQQLDRALYVQIDKVLRNAGGKWNRSARAHIFGSDPRTLLSDALDNGTSIDPQQKFQTFFTPLAVARRMVALAQIEPTSDVLEPSAGSGNIALAITERPHASLVCVELNPELADGLSRLGYTTTCADFLTLNDEKSGHYLSCRFDRIVMNPPFHNGADVKHIEHARTFLRPGGRLVALCANGPRQNDKLKPLCDSWEVLPAGTFKEQGTGVSVALLTIDAPAVIEADICGKRVTIDNDAGTITQRYFQPALIL